MSSLSSTEARDNDQLSTPVRQSIMSPYKNGTATATPTSNTKKGYTPAQRRFRPQIKKEEVAATDKTNASVKKISEWLSNDPFESKKFKKKPAVRGRNILTKSRKFEPDLPSPKAMEVLHKLQPDTVKHRKKWIERGYDDSTNADDACSPNIKKEEKNTAGTVSDRARWLQEKAFQKKNHTTTATVTTPAKNTTALNLNKDDFGMEDGRQQQQQEFLSCESFSCGEEPQQHQQQRQLSEDEQHTIVEEEEDCALQQPHHDPNNDDTSNNNDKQQQTNNNEDKIRMMVKNPSAKAIVSVSDRAKWLREDAFKKSKAAKA